MFYILNKTNEYYKIGKYKVFFLQKIFIIYDTGVRQKVIVMYTVKKMNYNNCKNA